MRTTTASVALTVCLATVGLETRASAQQAPPPAPSSAASPPPAPPLPPPPSKPTPAEAGKSTATTSPIPAPTPQEIKYRRLAVDVQSTRPDAVLERRVSVKETNGSWFVIPTHQDEATWEQVCVAPCLGVDLDRYSTYRVAAANHISASKSFTLPQGGDTTHLRLDAGDLLAHRAGLFVSSVGLAATIVGAAMLAAAPSWDDPASAHNLRVAGWITGFSGIALLAVGIPLAVLTNTTVYADNDVHVAKSSNKPHFNGSGFVF